jgi:hypothetical protein
MSRARLITCVLLPFAAGYYLSYLFRTINALIANDRTAELALGQRILVVDVGLLPCFRRRAPAIHSTDRHGPRTIQSVPAAAREHWRARVALADGLVGLVIGRVDRSRRRLAQMAGFKAIALWFAPIEPPSSTVGL